MISSRILYPYVMIAMLIVREYLLKCRKACIFIYILSLQQQLVKRTQKKKQKMVKVY